MRSSQIPHVSKNHEATCVTPWSNKARQQREIQRSHSKDLPALAPMSSDNSNKPCDFPAQLLTRAALCFLQGKDGPRGRVVGALVPQTAKGAVFRLAESQYTQDNGCERNLFRGIN